MSARIRSVVLVFLFACMPGCAVLDSYQALRDPKPIEKIGEVEVLDTRTVGITFPKPDCKKTDTCDLRRAEFREYFYRLSPEEHDVTGAYGRSIYASYSTDTVANLPRYGFVQFVRGCYFLTEESGTGPPRFEFGSRRHVGRSVLFRHKNWEVDTNDHDPFYSSDPASPNRHHFFGWSETGEAYDPRKIIPIKAYGDSPPSRPELFVLDIPSSVYATRTRYTKTIFARNASLEFRMCLFKTKDIPTDARKEKITAEPLACFRWDYHMIYDPITRSYRNPGKIAAACK